MKLYEIDKSLRELWDKIAEQDGELTEDDIAALESLSLEADDKIKGYGVIIKDLTAEIERCEAEIKRVKEISDRRKRKREWLENNLKDFMLNNNIPKYESVEVSVKFTTSKPLQIAETAEIPKEFMRIKEEPDKTAIKEYLNNGGIIEGCEIIEKKNIQIK